MTGSDVDLASLSQQTQQANERDIGAIKIYRQAMQIRTEEREHSRNHLNPYERIDSSLSSHHHAQQFCSLAAQLLHHHHSQQAEADGWYRSGLLAYQNDQVDRAIAFLEQARTFNFVTDQTVAEAKTLTLLGLAYRRDQQYRAALGCHMDAWRLYLEQGNRMGEIVNLAYLGQLYEKEGMVFSALDTYRRAIALLQTIEPNDYPNLTQGLDDEIPMDQTLEGLVFNMAQVLHQAGELDEVRTCYRQVVWCNNQ